MTELPPPAIPDLPEYIAIQPIRPTANQPPTWAVTLAHNTIGYIEAHGTPAAPTYHFSAHHPTAGTQSLEPSPDLRSQIDRLIALSYDPYGTRATRGW